ncbi:hypothetical protein FZC79_11530 [Rossellomorea vietnamensis]|jgi:hypothetical protein|uniref:Uncharacterized protein n=2 Tax=Rossellomorea TaxID=2837508 RepID=A0A5D4NTG3_9BACI|nr:MULTISPECIES: hypothetical protein [Rossellomorea]TYR75044.1 hypothetical protein FZC79_11530 [Rossellomorea vietnamensis]TYS16738.1 hypothetical protein FZC78_12195 [Rossellomorea vietnamensis]TYS79800.1 hypothetical protein FZC80_09175 [Rossellomorea aquimaris]
MESHRSKKISKLYRRIVTSDETKALLIYNGLDSSMKEELQQLMKEIGTENTKSILNRIS